MHYAMASFTIEDVIINAFTHKKYVYGKFMVIWSYIYVYSMNHIVYFM